MMTRKDYVATAEILKYVSDKTHPAVFSKMVNDFAEIVMRRNLFVIKKNTHARSNIKINLTLDTKART